MERKDKISEEDKEYDSDKQWEDYEKLNDMERKIKTVKKKIYQRRKIDINRLSDLLDEKVNRGICGSQNLGNTCFMNSAIQCVSHSLELTYFFLSGEYESEINPTNKLDGKLAKAWYSVLKDLWLERSRSVCPSVFKKTIAKIAPQFTGFGQQDSHELLTFLLDGIHEDLNKISNKPYMEISEKGENEDDEFAAKRFWDLHLLRNDSVIVDLFHGQYRSTITCPECHRVSITYDPFTTVPVPIPNLKKLDIYYVPQFNVKKTIKLCLFVSQDALFYDIAHYIDNAIGEKIGKFRCMIVEKNECVKMLKASDNILEASQKGYIFCYEMDPKLMKTDYYNLVINIWDAQKKEYKSFPRLFTISSSMLIADLKLIFYGFIRRFIDLPVVLNKHFENKFESLLESCQTNQGCYDEFNDIIKSEYDFLFYSHIENEELNKSRNEFISSMPYEVTLLNPKTNEKKILFGSNVHNQLENLKIDNSENSTETFKDDTSVATIIELIKLGYKINLEFISNDWMNPDKIKTLNSCINHASKNKDKKLNLFDCLEQFRLTEKLGKNNEWYCKDCKKHQRAYKKLELFYTPPLLILHLKRFEYSSSGRYRTHAEKIGGVIDFPLDDLDLSPYTIGPDSSNATYELYAVSQHYGSCLGGHYTAICKNNGKWYDFNDSSVSPSSESQVVTSAAYLLFYRRKN